MKVLVVGTGGSLSGSGVSTAADQMVRTLADMGHEPTRLVAGDRQRKRPNRLNLENVWAVLADAVAVGRAVRATGAELVWLHTMGVPALPALRAFALAVASRLTRRPIVVRFHAFDLEGQVASGGWLLRVTLRGVGLLSARLVAEHSHAADALEPLAPRGRVTALPNWVQVPDRPAPFPPGPPFTALFVGGLVRRKGVPQLIEAMRLLGDVPVRLRVVGGAGDDGVEAADAIRRGATDLVASGVVEFLGQLDCAAVRRELAGAHLFVLPSKSEGMPLSMIEALAEGRSVVVGDAGNMAEIVRRHRCGVVLSATNPEDVAAAIRTVIDDPDRMEELGARGHRVAMSHFSADAVRRLLEAVLETGVEGGRSAVGRR